MKLKKLFALTLSLGLGVSLASCGKDKENKNDTTTTSEVSSSTSVESSTSTSTSTSTSSQTSTTTSGEVDNEWTLITYEELCDYFENKDESNYNFLMINYPIDNKENYEYDYQKIENGKYYVSSVLNEPVDIYNYDFEWKEVPYLEVMAPDELNFFSQATKNDKGYYVSENGIYKFEKNTNNYKITVYDLDMNVFDIIILDKYFNMIEDEGFVKDEDGHIFSFKTVITWNTVDLTKIKGHIVVEK